MFLAEFDRPVIQLISESLWSDGIELLRRRRAAKAQAREVDRAREAQAQERQREAERETAEREADARLWQRWLVATLQRLPTNHSQSDTYHWNRESAKRDGNDVLGLLYDLERNRTPDPVKAHRADWWCERHHFTRDEMMKIYKWTRAQEAANTQRAYDNNAAWEKKIQDAAKSWKDFGRQTFDPKE